MDSKKIGEILRKLREDKGKSQSEVAVENGMSDSAISAYENGDRIPRDEAKIKLAKYFDKPVQEIFFDG